MSPDGIKLRIYKKMSGRGQKRLPWVDALYDDILSEFEHLRCPGEKFNTQLLGSIARIVIKNYKCSDYGPNLSDPEKGNFRLIWPIQTGRREF